MTRFILAAMIAATAGQAQALSCLPPDIARTFDWVAAAEERYIVLNGTFSFDALPRTRGGQLDPVTVTLESVFEGNYLGVDGFIDAPRLDVSLAFVCMGPWCGSMRSGDEVLVFAQQSADGYTVEVDPCYSTVFPSDDDTLERVEACMRGEACEETLF